MWRWRQTRVMHLQDKECQGQPTNFQELEGRPRLDSSSELMKEPTLLASWSHITWGSKRLLFRLLSLCYCYSSLSGHLQLVFSQSKWCQQETFKEWNANMEKYILRSRQPSFSPKLSSTEQRLMTQSFPARKNKKREESLLKSRQSSCLKQTS
jgi:hypothetical protein